MQNELERPERPSLGARLARELWRVTVAFTCVSLTYLVSGIPSGSLMDAANAPSMSVPAVVQAGSRTASRVAADSFWSQALGIRKQFVVYLPPSYEANGQRRFPVAY
jgi:enterochelin esterase-like enzyme